MSSITDPPALMALPLEVRHCIFEFVASSEKKPERLLQYWFEKVEVREKREARGWDEGEDDEEVEREGEDEGEYEGEDGEEDEEDDEEQDGEQDDEMEETDTTVISSAAAPTIPANAQGSTAADTAGSPATISAQHGSAVAGQKTDSIAPDQPNTDSLLYPSAVQSSTMAVLAVTSGAPQTSAQNDAEDEDAGADTDEDDEKELDAEDGADDEDAETDEEQEDNAEEDDSEDADSDSDEEMADEEDDEDNTATAGQPLPAPVITAHRKWRHIPRVRLREAIRAERRIAIMNASNLSGMSKQQGVHSTNSIRDLQFMRISHWPPPVELALTSQQLNVEAKDWFYNVAVLHIDATASFAHTSFFEEAFRQIIDAAFSPMENIRRVQVTFAWDTTWLRSDGADCAAAIFPALLRQRALFVTGILAQAPHLSEIVVHWHDSAEDKEAVDLMKDVLTGFLGLGDTVKVVPHFITVDAKPHPKTVAGKQRVEFQRIIDNGLDRLF